MHLISWNVNGIRAALRKGCDAYLATCGADVICMQETRALPEQVDLNIPGFQTIWNPAEKKGYSGTAMLVRQPPLRTFTGWAESEADPEGRVLTVEYRSFYLVTAYTPNARRDLSRLGMRQAWDARMADFLLELQESKPVVLCGDLNVAHTELDVKNARANIGNAGFTEEERAGFDAYLQAGLVDTFRHFCPDGGHFTWWSQMNNARARNVGWRIDYFCVSRALLPNLQSAGIHPEVMGSDHCPVSLVLQV